MLACLSPNGRAEYTTAGPITKLVVGTVNGVVILERLGPSADWQVTRTVLEGMQTSALVHEPTSGLIFAGTAGRGLYVSTDEGCTFELRTNGLSNNHVFAMALDHRGADPVLYAGMLPPALYRSRDLGGSWQELPTLNDVPDADRWNFRAPPGAPHVKNIAFDPSRANTLYVCIEQGGLMVSHDNGQQWREIDTWITPDDTFYRDSHRLVIQRSNPATMYMATGDGLCKTTDAGVSWERLTTGKDRVGYPDALFIDPADDAIVYVAGAGGHPGTWDQQTAQPGVIRSTDGGHTWQELSAGLPQPVRGNIEAVTMVDSSAGVAFFAGTAVGEIYASENRGETWQLIGNTPAVSKAGHFRKFLSPEERQRVERELMAQVATV